MIELDPSLKIINSVGEDEWIRFVLSQEDGNIFHTPFMHHVFQMTKNHRPEVHAVVSGSNGQIRALIVSVQVYVAGGLFKRFTGRSVLYGGILMDHCIASDQIPYLMREYDQIQLSRVLYTEIRNANSTADFRKALEFSGYEYRDYLNYQIVLNQPINAIFKSFSTSCKRNIRKAEKSGIEIRELKDPKEIPVFYELLHKTYKRAQVSIADISLFQNAFEVLYQRNMIRYFIAYLDQVPIACRSVFVFKDKLYDWYAGSDANYFRHCPNEWMVWHILQLGAQWGLKIFDFGGAGYPDEKYGVRDFKSRFGGNLVNHGRYMKIYSPFRFQFSKLGYYAYKHLM